MKEQEYEVVHISTPFIKLDSFLKFAGAAETGGHAKWLIEEGLVQVEGEVCSIRGKKLYPGTFVGCEGALYKVEGQEVAGA